MKQRILGKTGQSVSEIGLGTWQLGTRWGDPFNREEAFKILETVEAADTSGGYLTIWNSGLTSSKKVAKYK